MKGVFPHVIDGLSRTCREISILTGLRKHDIANALTAHPEIITSTDLKIAVRQLLSKPRPIQRPTRQMKRWNKFSLETTLKHVTPDGAP